MLHRTQGRARHALRGLAALALALAPAGCSPSSEPEEGTPLAALHAFNRALARGDYEEARRWCLPGDVQTEFLRNTFETQAAAVAFRSKVIEAFGEDELRRFHEPPGAIVQMDFEIPEERLRAAKVTELGQVAYVTLEDGMRMRLARTPEGWRFDGVGTENAQEIDWLRLQQQYSLGVAQILRRAVEKIDELPPATTPEERARAAESFDLEMGRVCGEHEKGFEAMLAQMQADAQAQAAQQQAQDVGPAPPAR